MIRIENASKKFKSKLIFENIDYTFNSNKLYLLSGEMGTGKSTLLKIILGIEPISTGIVVHDYEKVEFIYNEPWNYLYEKATSKANLSLYKELFHTTEEHFENIKNLFELSDLFKIKVCDLSTGNAKKISIACSLLNEQGKVIILDEPFTNLDKKTINILMRYLMSQKEDKIIIIVSHQFDSIKSSIDIHLKIKDNTLLECK